jgi:Holliday junction resolvasome RuvABC endonuclease subunit
VERKLKKPQPSLVTIGVDPSIRGTALAVVKDGALVGAYAWTEMKALQQQHKDRLVYYVNPKHPTDSDLSLRKELVTNWVCGIVSAFISPEVTLVVALEDYALSKNSSSVSDLHELGGMLKSILWMGRVRMRTYDPKSIKLAWASNGNATKDEMVEACLEAFDVDYSPMVIPIKRKPGTKVKPTAPKGKGPGYDLADATCIAFLAYRELLVKLGRCKLEELDEDLRRVMLRATKANPEAIASRPWVSVRDTSKQPGPIYASGEPQ